MPVDPAALVLRIVGAFYIFAGLVAMRAMVMDRLMDGMLAALSGNAPPLKDKVRRFLLGSGAALTFSGGIALALLHFLALPLMLLNAITQAVWLLYAQKNFPPEDHDDARGRRQTINAFMIYLAATALVFFVWRSGAVRFDHGFWAAAMLAAGLAGSAGWQFFRGRLARSGLPAQTVPEVDFVGQDLPEPSRHLRLAPYPGDWPIYDSDTGMRHSPEKLGLPDELVKRIAEFEEAVLAATDIDHADGPTVTDVAAYDRLAKDAEAIVTAMEEFFEPGVPVEDQTWSISWQLPGH